MKPIVLCRATLLFVFFFSLTSITANIYSQTENGSKTEGKFPLHKFEQAIGEETYVIEQSATGAEVASSFEFTDRGTKVPLTAKLQLAADQSPTFFSIQGSVARGNNIDASAAIDDQGIRVQLEKDVKELKKPEKFFFIEGYAPAVMQMMLSALLGPRWAP